MSSSDPRAPHRRSIAAGSELRDELCDQRCGEVQIPVDGVALAAELCVPPNAGGLILLAYDSGSAHRSPSNRFVAWIQQCTGLGTLLLDLLTREEELDHTMGRPRSDVRTLARRLTTAAIWIATQPLTADLNIGIFGSSSAAAAALITASRLHHAVGAVVSWSGRPDLADWALPEIVAPTLLMVGGRDDAMLEMNRAAFDRLSCEKRLEVVHNVSQVIEEPNTLNTVATVASNWFNRYLCGTLRLA
jgi:hypothetical protein